MKFEGRVVDAPRGGATPLEGEVSIRVGANGTAFISIPEAEARELFGAAVAEDGEDIPGKTVVIDGTGKDEGKLALVAADRPGAREVRRPPKRKSYEVSMPAKAVRLADGLSTRLPFKTVEVSGHKALVIELDPAHRTDGAAELDESERRKVRKSKASDDASPAQAAA